MLRAAAGTSVAVVACNKVAASSDYASYARLKSLAREFNAPFLFETNVGAGLPVIGTLNDLTRTGDVVRRMEAVLSGTLNFVFNNYDGTRPFAEVVRQAQAEGYTEPDPRLDLNGSDVARKILILAREAGQALEMSDINIEGFLPASCFVGDVEAFYAQMAAHEATFKPCTKLPRCRQAPEIRGPLRRWSGRRGPAKRWPRPRFVRPARQRQRGAVLHQPLPEQPLVVKGAGAGAEVTASGVFADIMRAARV